MQAAVEKRAGGGGANGVGGAGGRDLESHEESVSEGSIDRIPLRQWIMHGAVMFGREFCYAMETALVTPVLLQIGLPEQYYSLTWFLSPILGLIFTPLIGSASDRCTLRWGRRRPFILALCVGVLLGVALFLNGSLIGDVPNNQPIGIVMTVLGVVVLDFCADATEGPIRAYLLDVADTEEQDMALNIHAFSAGLGGAVGYALGGLDWTHTFLGRTFKSQEQILFLFAAVLFTVSVALHLFSIEEQQFSPQQDRLDEEAETESSPTVCVSAAGRTTQRTYDEPQRPRAARYQSLLHQRIHAPQTPHLLPTVVMHLLLLRPGRIPPLPLPARQRRAPLNSTTLHNYHRGVQMGCWGLVIYATTAAICSGTYPESRDATVIKVIYILGTLGFAIGTAVMAIFPNVYVSMVMISSMGIISMSISYCPYALLGQYHDNKEVRRAELLDTDIPGNSKRGFGIDCAILSCQVYISQILVASALGAVVDAVGSVRVIPMVASGDAIRESPTPVKYLTCYTRAARLIECDSHAHLVSKAGSVISSKSPSPAFRWSSIYFTEP
uniref:Solute carrier family 45 member 4 n=1 Tax=Sinocyclocheilus rhinocerous TaxID=307959 RepID=A0A673G144_9TELE